MNESKYDPKNQFLDGYEFISYLDSIPELKQYRKPDANYDDVYFDIPLKVLTNLFGWTAADIKVIGNSFVHDLGAGPVVHGNNSVTVHGSS